MEKSGGKLWGKEYILIIFKVILSQALFSFSFIIHDEFFASRPSEFIGPDPSKHNCDCLNNADQLSLSMKKESKWAKNQFKQWI